jgi:hypothetical protein
MTFQELAKKVKENFDDMQDSQLYRSSVTGHQLWGLYISGFQPGDNPVFRDPNSSYHNCNLDKSFINRYGNIVAIKENGELVTMWDLVNVGIYETSIKNMSNALKQASIKDVFVESYDTLNRLLNYEKVNRIQDKYKLGYEVNYKIYTQEEADMYGVVTANQQYTFYHFYAELKSIYVDKSTKSVESIMSDYRTAKEVFKRGLEEISLDTLELVRDLINQKSLLNGESYLPKLLSFIEFKKQYDSVENKDYYCWETSINLPIARFRNELIGTLCVELTEGEELNKACLNWNKRADPANYMKAVAPITETQKQQAIEQITELGYEDSFNRRVATLADIDVNEIKHINNNTVVKEASVFDKVKPSKSTQHKRSKFDNVNEVSIETFMKDILPNSTDVEVFVENRFSNNFVTMTTANQGKNPFKWNNLFSWTYKGNLAGKSEIKEAVKNAGGNVEGVLRFSMIWNYNDNHSDHSDLDAWCEQPDKVKIGYSTGFRKDGGNRFTNLSGQLDLDNTNPGNNLGVENIYFLDESKLKNGNYAFWVHQFNSRNSQGFKAEIEFDGQIYKYQYDRAVSGSIFIAEVTYTNGKWSIDHSLEPTDSEEIVKTVWNIDSNNFHKVSLVCLSPNYWGENNVGNKHYFFMLHDCFSDESIRGFHAENLNSELTAYRKFVDILGNFHQIAPSKPQLAGLGFNATVNDHVIVKVKGTHERVLKINF